MQETALRHVQTDDLEGLSGLLASAFPEDDASSAGAYLPLPEDHWINAPCGKEVGHKSLLHLAAEKKPPAQSVALVRLLLSAGAR